MKFGRNVAAIGLLLALGGVIGCGHCLSVWSSTWPMVREGGPTPANDGFEADSQLWNGSSWSAVTMPNPSPASGQFNFLSDESCVDASDCVVVGATTNVGSTRLIESWNGSTWMVDSIPQ
jgi:hypothetical protein